MTESDLPFKIGEQYENWEFDLEFCEKERIKGYDSYIYIREISFLGVTPQYVELVFCLDILVLVLITFKNIEFDNFKIIAEKDFEKIKISKIAFRVAILSNSNMFCVMYGYNGDLERALL